jgi:hypothetical protein
MIGIKTTPTDELQCQEGIIMERRKRKPRPPEE